QPVASRRVRAWAILGYFHGSMGDMANYEEYLKLSGSFLTDSMQQGSTDVLPAGFAEIVSQKDTVQVYSGHLDAAGIESLGTLRQDAPQVCEVGQSAIDMSTVLFGQHVRSTTPAKALNNKRCKRK
ncbi:unnamed protein product, partial [Ectocarpus sp. 13 AM-2016]